jgi:hypothetical protein
MSEAPTTHPVTPGVCCCIWDFTADPAVRSFTDRTCSVHGLQRWSGEPLIGDGIGFRRNDQGEWVRYEDFAAAIEGGREFREWIEEWAKAYPLDVFPEPDFKRVNEVLTAAGLSLDCVSAANMRHVITRVREKLRGSPDEHGSEPHG